MGARELQNEGDAILFWNDAALEAHRRDFTFTDADGEDETDAQSRAAAGCVEACCGCGEDNDLAGFPADDPQLTALLG
jgi:hypothetical protein